jgi:crotonobetaine/carnitine-CoA ligase
LTALPDAVAPADRTLPALLQRQAERQGERALFTAGATRWTVAQARDMAARMAGTIAGAGVRAGDRVAIMCGNRAEFMQLYLGCGWLGAVAVPVHVAARGVQLTHILRNSGAILLAVTADLLPALELVEVSSLSVARVWVIGDAPAGATPLPPPGEPVPPGTVGPGDTVAILYTSGTSGPSKGVCCPHAQYYWWGVNSAGLLGVTADDVLLTTLPLFHTNALNAFYQALVTGAHLVVEPRFSASGFAATLAAHRATVTYLLGAMVPILLATPPSPRDRAHGVRVGLGPGVPGHLYAAFRERFGIALIDGFGSTETNFVIGTGVAGQKPGWMGPVHPGFQARVVDADDNDVPDGEPGELVLRADAPFAFATGYFGMDDKTVAAWRNLWFHTGDRVARGGDGYFRFIDRLKDSIRRRGENISSFEVEQVILTHPAVATAAAYAVPSDLAEDEVMVAVVLRDGAALAPADLVAFCGPRMARFAVPRYIEFMAGLPVTESGKVQKFKLRERGVTATTWDREAT